MGSSAKKVKTYTTLKQIPYSLLTAGSSCGRNSSKRNPNRRLYERSHDVAFISDLRVWLRQRVDELLQSIETLDAGQRKVRWDTEARLDECLLFLSRLTGKSAEYERKSAEMRRLR